MRDSASGIETTKQNCILHRNIWKHLEPHSELILHFLILTVVSGYVHQATHVTSIFDSLKKCSVGSLFLLRFVRNDKNMKTDI